MMKTNETKIMMTTEDFSVCLAALVQTEAYWDFQLKRCDGDMPGGFTREEVTQIIKSILGVKDKIESILQIDENNVSKDSDHMIVN